MNRIVIDIETNGLHGEVITVGAFIATETGWQIGSFGGRIDVPAEEALPWVQENVLRHFRDDPERAGWLALPVYPSRDAMLAAFGAWLGGKSAGHTLWLDCGFPVEVRALHEMARAITNDGERFVVFHEIATVMLCAGIDPGIDRGRFSGLDLREHAKYAHNPVWDARVSSACLDRLVKMTVLEDD